MSLIYLAVAYSHADPVVREERFQIARRAAAELARKGHDVFSPICHSHPIATIGGAPTDWEQWRRVDERMLTACDDVWVLMIPGWYTSRGVTAEIEMARKLGKPVNFLPPGEIESLPAFAEKASTSEWSECQRDDDEPLTFELLRCDYWCVTPTFCQKTICRSKPSLIRIWPVRDGLWAVSFVYGSKYLPLPPIKTIGDVRRLIEFLTAATNSGLSQSCG